MPFKNKDDYNKWRRVYRKKQQQEGKCTRCYRPILDGSGSIQCVNCNEIGTQNKRLQRELYRGF